MIRVNFHAPGSPVPSASLSMGAVPRAGETVHLRGNPHRVVGVEWFCEEAGASGVAVTIEKLETPEQESERLERERAAKGRRGSAE